MPARFSPLELHLDADLAGLMHLYDARLCITLALDISISCGPLVTPLRDLQSTRLRCKLKPPSWVYMHRPFNRRSS